MCDQQYLFDDARLFCASYAACLSLRWFQLLTEQYSKKSNYQDMNPHTPAITDCGVLNDVSKAWCRR